MRLWVPVTEHVRSVQQAPFVARPPPSVQNLKGGTLATPAGAGAGAVAGMSNALRPANAASAWKLPIVRWHRPPAGQ